MGRRHRRHLFALCVRLPVRRLIPEPIHGVTVDDKNDIRDNAFIAKLLDSLRHLSVKPTVRIVYSPGKKDGYFSASSYLDATRQIKSVGYVFGQPVDSFYMRCFTPAEHLARFKDYVTTLGTLVDIWEVGNEINGEWLFGKTKDCSPKASVKSTSQADVVTKMTEAYDYLKSQGKVTALTLYYNTPCRRPAANEMFTWADANVPTRMKNGLDYLLVSYYEVDCNGYKPDWQRVISQLAAMFPNSKLGISEFGLVRKETVRTHCEGPGAASLRHSSQRFELGRRRFLLGVCHRHGSLRSICRLVVEHDQYSDGKPEVSRHS